MHSDDIPQRSLVDSVVEQLRSTIESGQWPVGQKLPAESALAARLSIDRNTLRQALGVLEHTGLLQSRHGDGTYVLCRVDPTEALRRLRLTSLRDQLEMRIALETEAARLAAERRYTTDLDAMHAALIARSQAGSDVQQRILQDHRFHTAVITAAHNSALTALYTYFSEMVAETISQIERDSAFSGPSHAQHETLLACIERGDSAAAAETARLMLRPSLAVLEPN